jgi:vitamin B12 transporter
LADNDPIPLQEVTVRSSRVDVFAVGAHIDKPDTLLVKVLQSASLSELLAVSSGATINSYGVGGLSTISLRGGGGTQAAVVWNGINIQSPMNGGVNLSGMPTAFFGNIQIQQGGSGTLVGSGAMSGILHLSGENLFHERNGGEVRVGLGNFENRQLFLSGKYGNEKVATSVRVMGQMARNNFTYENTARINDPLVRQTNAGLKQGGVMQEAHIRLRGKTLLTTGLWYQHYDKDLQTQMTSSNPAHQNQTDDNVLGSLNLRFYGQGYSVNVKQGVVLNQVDYTDPDMPTSSALSRSMSLMSEADGRIQLNARYLLNIGLNYTHDRAETEGYGGLVSRDRLAFFSFLRMNHFNGQLVTVLSLRDEASNETLHPLVFSIGNDWHLTHNLAFKTNLSKNYRIPTLNDLYWLAGAYAKGNPNLKPESGWSGEGGLYYARQTGSQATELSGTLFFTYVKDWIVWLQDSAIWEPTNKKTGRSHGLEARAGHAWRAGDAQLGANLSYFYTFSQLGTEDAYDGKQMIYIPRHKASALMTAAWKKLEAGFVLSFTGERYYDYANTIDPYLLGDAFASWRLPVKNAHITLNGRVNNIWNNAYQVMAFYAMPQRNYNLALAVTF